MAIRFALLSVALLACATKTPPRVEPHPINPARTAALALGARGEIDRAVKALAEVDASDPATIEDTEVEEVTWLADLSRCKDARALAKRAGLGEAIAALRATAECDRIEKAPSGEALTTMRARFHEAVALERSDPARAIALYASAWGAAPTGAVMLGLARAARAKGDLALAEQSFERALGWAERDGARPQLVIGVPQLPESVKNERTEIAGLSFGKSGARFQFDLVDTNESTNSRAYVVREDYKTGALNVLLPDDVIGISERYAIPKGLRGMVVELGVDDETTARRLPALDRTDSASLSPNGKVVLVWQSRAGADHTTLIELATGRKLWSSPQTIGGTFLSDDQFLLDRAGQVPCILSAPEWKTCVDLPNVTLADGGGSSFQGSDIVLSTDDQISIYDLAARRVKARFKGHFRSVTSLPLSPNGEYLLTRSQSRVIAWNVKTGAHWKSELNPYDSDVAFSDDGAYLVNWTRYDGVIDVYDATKLPALVETSQLVFGLHPPSVQLVDGRFLVSGQITALVDLRSGAITRYACTSRDVSVSLSRWIVCGDDVFDLASGAHVASRAAPSNAVDAKELESIYADIHYVAQLPTTASAGPITVTASDGSYVVEDHAKGSTSRLVISRNDAIVPAGDGKSRIIGDEADVQCRVGDVWLPLDACRDRLLTH